MTLTPAELAGSLAQGSALVRVGVVFIPDKAMDSLPLLGIEWDVSVVDIVPRWLARLPQGTRFVGIKPQPLLAELSAIAGETHDRRCALVANVDVLLAKLSEDERIDVWAFLFSSLKKQRTALLLALPVSGASLLPMGEDERWARDGRLSRPPEGCEETQATGYMPSDKGV